MKLRKRCKLIKNARLETIRRQRPQDMADLMTYLSKDEEKKDDHKLFTIRFDGWVHRCVDTDLRKAKRYANATRKEYARIAKGQK